MEVIGAAESVNKSNSRGTDTWNLLGQDPGTGDVKDATFLTNHQGEVISVREGRLERGGYTQQTIRQAFQSLICYYSWLKRRGTVILDMLVKFTTLQSCLLANPVFWLSA